MEGDKATTRKWVGIGILTLTALGFVLIGAKPNWVRDISERVRHSQEGWELLRPGEILPISLRTTNPAKDGFRGFSADSFSSSLGTKAWILVESKSSMTGLCSYTAEKLPAAYAVFVLPDGSRTLKPLQIGAKSNQAYIEVPFEIPDSATSIDVQLMVSGHEDSRMRINRLPSHPYSKAQPLDNHPFGLEARAFPVKAKDAAVQVEGLGYRLRWSTIDTHLAWQLRLTSIQRNGTPFNAKEYVCSLDIKGPGTLGELQPVPFASSYKDVTLAGEFRGTKDETKLLDFGTAHIVEDKSRRSGSTSYYYLDIANEISKEVAPGVRVVLSPLKSGSDTHTSYSGMTLYYRLRLEYEPGMKGKSDTHVECTLVPFENLSGSEVNEKTQTRDDLRMARMDEGAERAIHLEVIAKIRHVQKRLPFVLSIPVDKTKVETADWKMSLFGDYSMMVNGY